MEEPLKVGEPALTSERLAVLFDEQVLALAKPGKDILATLTPEKCHLWHMATGCAGEAGELLDAIKKHVLYNKDLDRANIVEELGDFEFYKIGICQALGISQEEILTANMRKLSTRYSAKQYSDAQAQARADKA